MIRMIGEKQDPHDYLSVSKERMRTMEGLASTHIKWFTHKNPYGCWICDLFVLTENLMNSFEDFLGPDSNGSPEEPEATNGISEEALLSKEEDEP